MDRLAAIEARGTGEPWTGRDVRWPSPSTSAGRCILRTSRPSATGWPSPRRLSSTGRISCTPGRCSTQRPLLAERSSAGLRTRGSGLTARGEEELTGFAVAGSDRKFVWADARIEGDTVVVSSEAVPKPVAVRYG